MHQAAYHGRPEMVRVLIELCREKGVLEQVLNMHSNPAGRGPTGIPLELAEGGGHDECARLIEEAMQSLGSERNDDWEEGEDYSHFESFESSALKIFQSNNLAITLGLLTIMLTGA